MRYTTKLLPSRSSNLGVLELNNPRPLHALTLDMLHCWQDVLQQWFQDDSLAGILVKAAASSSSDTKVPAFCSGGDVKQVYFSGLQTETTADSRTKKLVHGQGRAGIDTAEFFRQEYYVNHMIATSPKPQVSLWNGIVMGGGVGISIHGRYRVATEHTVFAMPETAIGLFPDVGSMWWMPRLLPPSVACYLALTGKRLTAPDLVHWGLATHYIPSYRVPDLEVALVNASQSLADVLAGGDVLIPVLRGMHEVPLGEPELQSVQDEIDQAFGLEKSVEDIVATLEGMQSDFSKTTLETLRKMSPTSLKVTLEGLRRGAASASITDDLRMEFRMAQACMREGSDFYEGIRAVLVDKDQQPRWNPSTLHDVSTDVVESYFSPLEEEWEIPKELLVPNSKISNL